MPKYTVTYDANLVLDHFKTQPLNENITLKQLTLRLTTLLCFLTAHRDQTLNLIDINHMYRDDNKIVFYIPKMVKNTTPTFHPHPMELIRFPDDKSICIIEYLNIYLERTKPLRGVCTNLLISYVPPHKQVKTSTVSRWVRAQLKEAGIDTTTFTSHSTRSSSTSLAKQKGLNIEEIRKAAGWGNCATFAKHYDKPILQNFGDFILSNQQ